MSSLKTSLDGGLNGSDFEARQQQFGSNFKAPPKLTPYWRLFLNAMDDFMLKFLLVCAAVQITIEMAFSTPEHRQTGM
jgi:magnesium-transporting ATPase (P-type)